MENSNIYPADKKEPTNPAHKGNPLLESLFDILEPQKFYQIIAETSPLGRNEILDLLPEIRPQYLDDVRSNFLVPNSRLYAVYKLIHTSINNSYCLRNPLKNTIKSNLQRDYRDFTKQLKDNFVSTFSNSSMIVGVSGIGKTTSLNLGTALFPPALKHTDVSGEFFIQVPIIKIECPKDGSIKDLCRYFFIELDRILGKRKYELEYCKNRDNASDRVIAMSKLVAAHCIGLLIVDEIQHLNKAKSAGAELVLNFFLHLDNTLHIPIILVGTPEATDLFSDKLRLRRRFSAGATLRWDRLPQDKEWDIIVKQLFKYQYTEEQADPLVNWSDLFYYHAQGIIDRAVKIFIAAQKFAFDVGAKALTIDMVNAVVRESMWLDEDIFENIREGRQKTLLASDLFQPEEKTDKKLNYRMINIQNELTDFDVPENFSFPLIEQLMGDNPSENDNEIAFKIMKAYNHASSKNDSNSKKKNSRKLQKNLIDGDMRKCTIENASMLHEQLVELNIITKLESYMM